MSKFKRKATQKSYFRYLVDEYILFRRDFVIETSASVEDCARHIQALSYENQGCWRKRRILASTTYLAGKRHFEIRAAHPHKWSYAESASAEGTIEREADGVTIVAGTVLMSSWQYWSAIFGLSFLLLVFLIGSGIGLRELLHPAALIYFGSFVVLIIFNWLRMYRDRNYLLQQIEAAVHNAERDERLV